MFSFMPQPLLLTAEEAQWASGQVLIIWKRERKSLLTSSNKIYSTRWCFQANVAQGLQFSISEFPLQTFDGPS